MKHPLRLTAVFLLAGLATHLAVVLLAPQYHTRALLDELQATFSTNTLHPVRGDILRRLARHPHPDARHAVCMLDLRDGAVMVEARQPRSYWSLTVYSPSADVLYAITDRHLPPGRVRIRFEPRAPAARAGAGIALARLAQRTLRVPLAESRAILVVETLAWHPGQADVLDAQLRAMRCAPAPRNNTPPAAATSTDADNETNEGKGHRAAPVRPTPRPSRP